LLSIIKYFYFNNFLSKEYLHVFFIRISFIRISDRNLTFLLRISILSLRFDREELKSLKVKLNRRNFLKFSHHKDHIDSIQNIFVIFRDINPFLAFIQIGNTRIL